MSKTRMSIVQRKTQALGRLIVEKSSFADVKSRHKKIIFDHGLNHAVSLTLPVSSLPESLTTPVLEGKSYLVQLPLVELISSDFIEAFVKAGDITLLSFGTKIDTDDCIAILPTGQLVLHLTKDTYQTLGLEGKPSLFSGRNPYKFIAQLDLRDDKFVPGKSKYDKLWRCLSKRDDLVFEFLVTWTSRDDNLCSSSIQKYFQMKGYTAQVVKLKETQKFYSKLNAPVFCSSQTTHQTADDSCSMYEVFDWLGAVALSLDLSQGSPDDYVTSMTVPQPEVVLRHCVYQQFQGLVTSSAVQKVLDAVRQYVEAEECPWGCLTVHGFADSPVSIGTREHGFCSSGDNFYSFLVFPNQCYWLYTAFATHDICS